MRTFRVVGASVTEAAKWESKFNQALQSPEQMEGVIKTGADLLRSRLEAVDDQWRRGMKTDKGFPDIISPKNQEFLDSIGVKYNVNRSEAARARAEAAGAIPKPAAATAAGNDIQVGRGGLRYQYVGPPGGDRTKKENWKALQ